MRIVVFDKDGRILEIANEPQEGVDRRKLDGLNVIEVDPMTEVDPHRHHVVDGKITLRSDQ